MGAQLAIALTQEILSKRPVKPQEVNQPTVEMRIAAGTAQANALQQPQGGSGRQPAVVTHPAVHAEQGQGQPPLIEADGDQVGERSPWLAAAEQMQVAVLAVAAVAVVVTLGATGRIHQVARRVVLVLNRGGTGGEGTHQRPVAIDQAKPVVEGFPSRSIALDRAERSGAGRHQREGPQPPSWAPQPPEEEEAAPLPGAGLGLAAGAGFGAVVLGCGPVWRVAAGRLALP